jgi:hypothetical protein
MGLVLDRLPAFRYRFVSVDCKLPQPQTSTLNEGWIATWAAR